MFDFQNLAVYKKSKFFHIACSKLIIDKSLDNIVSDQLYRASFSVCLNIGEGSGRFTNPDRRHFFIIARSSLFESVSILEILNEKGIITKHQYDQLLDQGDEISRLLFSMIRNLNKKSK